jgi:hypothetical protein
VAGATEFWGQLQALFQAGFDILSAGWTAIVTAAQAVSAIRATKLS